MDYFTNYDSAFKGLMGGFAIFAVIIVVFLISILIVSIVASWKMYKKAGKSGWECIVPFYGNWVLVEIAGLEWWWFLLLLANNIVNLIQFEDLEFIANLVSLFATFNIFYNIAKKFGKENGIAICSGLFSGIFVFIFGFSKNEVYNASIPVSKNGIFGSPDVSNTGNTNAQNYQSNTYGQNNIDTVSTQTVDRNQNNTVSNETINQEFSFCGNCGTKMNKDAKFCPNCGKEKV